MPIYNETATGGVLCAGTASNTAIFSPGVSGGARNGGNVEWDRGTIIFTGFEAGSNFTGAASGPVKEYFIANSGTGGFVGVESGIAHGGDYAFHINKAGAGSETGSAQFGASLWSTYGQERILYTRFYFRLSSLPSARQVFYTCTLNSPVGGSPPTFSMSINNAGNVVFRNENTSVQIGTSATTLSAGNWYRIESRQFVRDDGGGTEKLNVQVLIDGTSELSTDLSHNVAGFLIHAITLGIHGTLNTSVAVDYYFDDVLIRRHGWIGKGLCQYALLPIGNGQLSQWVSGSNASTPGSYTEVDELPHTGDNVVDGYITSSATGATSLFQVEVPTNRSISGLVNAVSVLVVARLTALNASQLNAIIYKGSALIDSKKGTMLTTYSSHVVVSDGPYSALWDETSLNDAEIGVSIPSGSQTQRVTAVYLFYDEFNGIINERASGGAVTGGTATVNTVQTYTLTPSGVLIGGSSNRFLYIEYPAGGIQVGGGTRPDPHTFRFTGFETGVLESGEYTPNGNLITLDGTGISHGGLWTCRIQCSNDNSAQYLLFDNYGTSWSSPGEVTKFGNAFADDASIGTNSWTNPENAATDNNSYATCTKTSGSFGHYLRITDFGFSVPTDAHIISIEVFLRRKSSAGSEIVDNQLSLLRSDGSIDVINNADQFTAWSTTEEFRNAWWPGSAGPYVWTPAEVNSANFGVVLSPQFNTANGVASIDVLTVKVTYSSDDALQKIIYSRFYINFNELPHNTGTQKEQFYSMYCKTELGNIGLFSLTIDKDGFIAAEEYVGASQAPAINALQLNKWYRIECRHLISDADQSIEVRVNGTLIISLTGTRNYTGYGFAQAVIGRNGATADNNWLDFYVDDVIFQQAGWIGLGQCLLKTVDGTSNEIGGGWTVSPSGEKYLAVDDNPVHDGDATYLVSGGPRQITLFSTNIDHVGGEVNSVKALAIARKESINNASMKVLIDRPHGSIAFPELDQSVNKSHLIASVDYKGYEKISDGWHFGQNGWPFAKLEDTLIGIEYDMEGNSGVTVEPIQDGSTVNYIFEFTPTEDGLTAGYFRIQFGRGGFYGPSTDILTTYTAAEFQTALEDTVNGYIDPGDIIVSGNPLGPWTVEMTGPRYGGSGTFGALSFVEIITFPHTSKLVTENPVPPSQTGSPHFVPVLQTGLTTLEKQSARLFGNPSAGTWTLTFHFSATQQVSTAPLAFNAAGAVVATALRNALGLPTNAITAVRTGTANNWVYTITFRGEGWGTPYTGTDLLLMTADSDFERGTIRTTALYIIWDEASENQGISGGVLAAGDATYNVVTSILSQGGGGICGGTAFPVLNGMQGGGVVTGGHGSLTYTEVPSGGVICGGVSDWARGTIGFTGFEAGPYTLIGEPTAGYEFSISGGSIVSTTVRTGTYAYKVNVTGPVSNFITIQKRNCGDGPNDPPASFVRTAYARFYIKFNNLPNQQIYVGWTSDGVTTPIVPGITGGAFYTVALTIKSTGVLSVLEGGTSPNMPPIAEYPGTTPLAMDTWHLIEVRQVIIGGNTINVGVRLNGNTEITAAFVANYTGHLFSQFTFGKTLSGVLSGGSSNEGLTCYYDDILVREHGWVGKGFIKVYLPSGNGDESDWSGSYTDIDEIPSDNDTTYISSTSEGDRSSFATQNPRLLQYANSVKSIAIAKDNVALISQGPNSVQTVTAVSSGWSGLGNCSTSDNSYAQANLVNSNLSTIQFTNFSFSLPPAAIIGGIKVEIEHHQSGGGNIKDWQAILIKNSIAQGSDLNTFTSVPTSDAYKVYGANNNTWGLSWTANEINSPNFGFQIIYQNVGNSAGTIFVDHVRITVYYTVKSYIRVFVNSGGRDLYREASSNGTTDYRVFDTISDFDQTGTTFTESSLANVEIGVKHQTQGSNTFLRTTSLYLMVDAYGEEPFVPTGGVLAGGHGALSYNQTASGGVLCGGTAFPILNGMQGGGVVCGGTADNSDLTFGGAVCGGSADWDRGTLAMTGFESGVTSEEVNGGGVVSTLAHAGNYSYRVQLSNGSTLPKYVELSSHGEPFGMPNGEKIVYVRFYMRVAIRPTTSQLVYSCYIWDVDPNPTSFVGQIRLRLRSDGKLDVYNESTFLETIDFTLENNTWYRIELRHFIRNLAIETGVRINGDDVLVRTDAGTFNSWAVSHVRIGKDSVQGTTSNIDVYYDDVLICRTGWIGPGYILGYQVTGQSGAVNWTAVPSTTTDHWTRIQELPPNNDTTYLTTSSSGSGLATFITDIDSTTIFRAINTIKVVAFLRTTTTALGPTITIYAIDDGQNVNSNSHTINNFYQGYSVICDKSKNNSLWTASSIENLELGIAYASTSQVARLTSLYAMVDLFGNPVIFVTASGGVKASGAAIVSQVSTMVASGGVKALGGSSPAFIEYPSGGILIAGSAISVMIYVPPHSGGVKASKTSGTRFVEYNPTPTGGVLAAGTARVIFGIAGEGGALAGGGASITFFDQVQGSGGVLCGGTATVNGSQTLPVSGGVLAGGEAPVTLTVLGAVSGGILAGGHAWATYTDIPSGGVLCGGSSTVSVTFLPSGGVLVNSTATSQYVLNIARQFTWNIGEGIYEWYRVEGDCQQKVCPPLADDGFCQWGSSNIVNIMARSVEEVLDKLVDRGWNWPIKSIKKFTRTVFAGDNSSDSNPDCNELLPISFEDITLPEGISDLFIQEDVITTTHISADVTSNIFAFTASGSLFVFGGSAAVDAQFINIKFGGVSPVESSAWNFAANGGIVFGGTSPIESSLFDFATSGGITFGGSSNANSIISSNTGGGVMVFAGGADVDMPGTENVISNVVISTSIIEVELFTQENASIVQTTNTLVTVSCCPKPIPRTLQLNQTNLRKANNLSQFLLRNNLTLPENIKLIYNKNTKIWQGNIYYRGFAYDLPEEQIWNLTFEFGCVTQVGPTDLGSGVWKFAMYIKSKNLTSHQDFDTRFITFFMPSTLGSSPIDFSFTLNTKTKITNPSSVINTMLNDDIRVFQSKYWISNPNVIFRIQDTETSNIENTIDYPEVTLPISSLRPEPVT